MRSVSPLFGNKEDKVAQEAAAKAEAGRLGALSVAELAAEMMPAFGADGPGRGSRHEVNVLQVANWLMSPYPRGTKFLGELEQPVREGIQALEHAGLVQRWGEPSAGGRLSATRLGEAALADGSVRQYLDAA
jgi:hypothetical protein